MRNKPDRKILEYLGFDFDMLEQVEKQYKPIEWLAPEIAYMWIYWSIKQGNQGNMERFLEDPRIAKGAGGVNWEDTLLGYDLFHNCMDNKNFSKSYINDLKIFGIPQERIEKDSCNVLPSLIIKELKKLFPDQSTYDALYTVDTYLFKNMTRVKLDKSKVRYAGISTIISLHQEFIDAYFKNLPLILVIMDAEGNIVRRLVISVSEGGECEYKTKSGIFKGKLYADS